MVVWSAPRWFTWSVEHSKLNLRYGFCCLLAISRDDGVPLRIHLEEVREFMKHLTVQRQGNLIADTSAATIAAAGKGHQDFGRNEPRLVIFLDGESPDQLVAVHPEHFGQAMLVLWATLVAGRRFRRPVAIRVQVVGFFVCRFCNHDVLFSERPQLDGPRPPSIDASPSNGDG